jgi:hypothetical protein
MKKIILSLILCISLISLVSAASYDYTTNWFYSGSPVNNIRAINYVCNDLGCYNLGTRLSDQTSSTNSVTVSYPLPSTTYGYATYWFSSCYVYQEVAFKPCSPTSCSSNTYSETVDFTKKDNCKAEITNFNMPTSITKNNQITVTANIASALSELPIAPFSQPSDSDIVRDYFSAQSNIILEIRDSGNNLVYTETKQKYILMDDSESISFTYTPTQPGTYNVTLKTTVIDCKCSSNIIKKTSKLLIVNDIVIPPTSTTTTVIVNPTSPITYGTSSNFACSNSAGQNTVMKINNVDKTSEKGLNVLRAAGTFVINCSFAGNSNYESSSQQITYTINKINPVSTLSLTANPSWTVNNGIQTTVTGTGCPSQLTCVLTRDSSSVSNPNIATLPVGVYNYIYSTSGNENYTSASISNTLNIISSPIDITPPTIIVYSPTNTNYNYSNILINFTATDDSGISSMWYNNGTKNITYTTPVYVNLSNGNYIFTFYANDTLNNINSITRNFVVTVSSNPIIQCSINSDCGITTSSLTCIGNNLTNATLIPLCINNSCQSSASYLFIQKCQYGCSNGKCNSCPTTNDDDDDNEHNQIVEEEFVCGNDICESWLGENEFNCEEDCLQTTVFSNDESISNLSSKKVNVNYNINIILISFILFILLLLILLLFLRRR